MCMQHIHIHTYYVYAIMQLRWESQFRHEYNTKGSIDTKLGGRQTGSRQAGRAITVINRFCLTDKSVVQKLLTTDSRSAVPTWHGCCCSMSFIAMSNCNYYVDVDLYKSIAKYVISFLIYVTLQALQFQLHMTDCQSWKKIDVKEHRCFRC